MIKVRLQAMLIPLVACLSACGLPQTQDEETGAMKLSSSIDLAITWLDVANSNAPSTIVRNRIANVTNVLESREILLEETDDGGYCADNTEEEFTLAYIVPPLSSSSIRVCQEALTFDKSIVAQTLIHEGIHASGNTSECSTTQQELQYMTLAGEQPFRNVYVDDPECSSYNLGNGIDFIVLDDASGVPIPVGGPQLRGWRTHDVPHGARYTRMRSKPQSLLVAVLGREPTSWLSSIFLFLSR